MVSKQAIEDLKRVVQERKTLKIQVKDEKRVESPEQWFIRQIWENITFDCFECGGIIKRVMLRNNSWRWTCTHCGRDFGYNTAEPLSESYQQCV